MVVCSKDRLLFSQMSAEDCMDLLFSNGKNLGSYTTGQISEMKLSQQGNVFAPTLMVTSLDGSCINTGITLEELSEWNNR